MIAQDVINICPGICGGNTIKGQFVLTKNENSPGIQIGCCPFVSISYSHKNPHLTSKLSFKSSIV